MTMEIWTAFILGILGSIHCLGMCGPIVLLLPSKNSTPQFFILTRFIYNVGRIITYAILGAISGWIGHSLIIAGHQKTLSITLGILILLMILLPSSISGKIIPLSFLNRYIVVIKKFWGELFRNNAILSLFTIGVLNGFLPCGLVYIALAGAASTGKTSGGFFYMVMFGLGTFPVMIAVSIFSNLIKKRFRQRILKLLPVSGVILAILIILRGLSLGIPYISPKIISNNAGIEIIENCHSDEN